MNDQADELCACGLPLHYRDPDVRAFVQAHVMRLGATMRIRTPAGVWHVPRHYIALHGIRADQLPKLAAKYGWLQEAA